MIISHRHKFIFIKTIKTAGTSIEIALSKICGPDDIVGPLSPEDEKYRNELGYTGKQNYKFPFSTYTKKDILKLLYYQHKLGFYQHTPAVEIMERISSDIWDEYYKFCFERNPFDKFISWYYWEKGDINYGNMLDFIKAGEASDLSSFELYTIDCIPVVDSIYKFENLNRAINDINDKLNQNAEIKLPPKKAKGNIRKDKRHYSKILNESEAEWISKIFARELAYFDYEY